MGDELKKVVPVPMDTSGTDILPDSPNGNEPGIDSTIHSALSQFAKRLESAKSLRDGLILFRFIDGKPCSVVISSLGKSVKLSSAPPEGEPLIEIIGSRSSILPVLKHEKDGFKQFAAGGFRIVA